MLFFYLPKLLKKQSFKSLSRKRRCEYGYDFTVSSRYLERQKRGLRKDLVQKLYDLQPGFLRFPAAVLSKEELGRTLSMEKNDW
jgi:hypothetical protein